MSTSHHDDFFFFFQNNPVGFPALLPAAWPTRGAGSSLWGLIRDPGDQSRSQHVEQKEKTKSLS